MSRVEAPPALAEGDVVAGRFRVTRFIARGGMGEVYEAHDRELDAAVALKILRPDLAGDAVAVDRLRREIHLARQVTHRGVCRIYDLFRHSHLGDDGLEHPLVGFSMELLAGETLQERLQRAGALDLGQALAIATQAGAALGAAHAAGVIHRDLKSSNLMLVPDGDGERVVITDFGLARAADVGTDLESLTGSDSVVGTLAYMAPEQLEGEEATAAADIYAFGTMLYEMVSGSRPFTGRSAISNAVRRLSSAPPSPRVHVPDLPQRWERAILRCLERQPEDRYPRALDVVADLRGGSSSGDHSFRRAAVTAGIVVVLVLALAAAVLWPRLGPGHRAAQGPASPRSSVAVLGFRNLTARADADWLATALSETLLGELAAGSVLHTVPGETVARNTDRLELPPTDSLATDTLTRLRRLLDADFVVLGSYVLAADGRLRIDVRVQSTRDGATVLTVSDTRTEDDLLTMVVDLGQRLRSALGVATLDVDTASALRASLPSDPDAARRYALGLDRLRRFDAAAAVELLGQAAAADPDFPLVHSALARAWARLGADREAAEAARRAWELAGNLPEEERLVVEGQYREIAGDWGRAIDVYGRLHTAHPDEVEYGLRLAHAMVQEGRAADALGVLAELGDGDDDPRIALAEADAAGALSDYRRQLASAERAVAAATALDAGLLTAEGHMEEAWAAWRTGRPDRAKAALEQARRRYETSGDRGGVAGCLRLTAAVLHDQGRYDEARERADEALAIYRGLGSRAGTARCLVTLADVLSSQNDTTGAAALYWQAHEIFSDAGDLPGVSQCLNNLAIIRWEEGSFTSALELYEHSLEISRQLGDRSGVATCLNNIAVVLHDQGDLGAARRRYLEALAISREIGEPAGVATALNNLGELLRQQGELDSARVRYEESLALRRAADDLEGIETGVFNVAEVLREQGRLALAESGYRESLDLCRQLGAREDEVLSLSRLALVRLARGRPDDADRLLDEAGELVDHGASRSTLAILAASRGDLLHAHDELDAAARAHADAARLFSDHGDRIGEAEATLALAGDHGEAGDHQAAADTAERARSLFSALGNRDREAQAATLAARSLASLGRETDAEPLAEAAFARLDDSESCQARFFILLQLASFGRSGEELRGRLEQAAEQARTLGCVLAGLELRLALGRLDLAASSAEAHRDLGAVADEARRRGLDRLARRAETLLGR